MVDLVAIQGVALIDLGLLPMTCSIKACLFQNQVLEEETAINGPSSMEL